MKTKFIALAFLIASIYGCASRPVAVAEPITVKVPISTPCKTPTVERPDFAVDSLQIGASIYQQVQALLAERLQRIGYEAELTAAVGACQ